MFSTSVFYNSSDESSEGEEIEAHPSIWLSPNRTHCRWPPSKKAKKAIKEQQPVGVDWSVHRVRIIFQSS